MNTGETWLTLMSKNSSTKMNSLQTESTISLLADLKTSSNGNKRWFFDRAIAVMIGGASIRVSMMPRSVASSEAISLP
jgi:phage gp46-like protein